MPTCKECAHYFFDVYIGPVFGTCQVIDESGKIYKGGERIKLGKRVEMDTDASNCPMFEKLAEKEIRTEYESGYHPHFRYETKE